MGSNENAEKHEAPVKLDAGAPGLELTTVLPEGAKTNARGVPTYMGLAGTKLISMITVFATTGFCKRCFLTPPIHLFLTSSACSIVRVRRVPVSGIGCSGAGSLRRGDFVAFHCSYDQ